MQNHPQQSESISEPGGGQPMRADLNSSGGGRIIMDGLIDSRPRNPYEPVARIANDWDSGQPLSWEPARRRQYPSQPSHLDRPMNSNINNNSIISTVAATSIDSTSSSSRKRKHETIQTKRFSSSSASSPPGYQHPNQHQNPSHNQHQLTSHQKTNSPIPIHPSPVPSPQMPSPMMFGRNPSPIVGLQQQQHQQQSSSSSSMPSVPMSRSDCASSGLVPLQLPPPPPPPLTPTPTVTSPPNTAIPNTASQSPSINPTIANTSSGYHNSNVQMHIPSPLIGSAALWGNRSSHGGGVGRYHSPGTPNSQGSGAGSGSGSHVGGHSHHTHHLYQSSNAHVGGQGFASAEFSQSPIVREGIVSSCGNNNGNGGQANSSSVNFSSFTGLDTQDMMIVPADYPPPASVSSESTGLGVGSGAGAGVVGGDMMGNMSGSSNVLNSTSGNLISAGSSLSAYSLRSPTPSSLLSSTQNPSNVLMMIQQQQQYQQRQQQQQQYQQKQQQSVGGLRGGVHDSVNPKSALPTPPLTFSSISMGTFPFSQTTPSISTRRDHVMEGDGGEGRNEHSAGGHSRNHDSLDSQHQEQLLQQHVHQRQTNLGRSHLPNEYQQIHQQDPSHQIQDPSLTTPSSANPNDIVLNLNPELPNRHPNQASSSESTSMTISTQSMGNVHHPPQYQQHQIEIDMVRMAARGLTSMSDVVGDDSGDGSGVGSGKVSGHTGKGKNVGGGKEGDDSGGVSGTKRKGGSKGKELGDDRKSIPVDGNSCEGDGGQSERRGTGDEDLGGGGAGGSGIMDTSVPRRQRLRFEGDLYTPEWVRFEGQAKEGLCNLCSMPGRYHKQFVHGISSVSGVQFVKPVDLRVVYLSGPAPPPTNKPNSTPVVMPRPITTNSHNLGPQSEVNQPTPPHTPFSAPGAPLLSMGAGFATGNVSGNLTLSGGTAAGLPSFMSTLEQNDVLTSAAAMAPVQPTYAITIMVEGLCHQCQQWLPLLQNKRRGTILVMAFDGTGGNNVGNTSASSDTGYIVGQGSSGATNVVRPPPHPFAEGSDFLEMVEFAGGRRVVDDVDGSFSGGSASNSKRTGKKRSGGPTAITSAQYATERDRLPVPIVKILAKRDEHGRVLLPMVLERNGIKRCGGGGVGSGVPVPGGIRGKAGDEYEQEVEDEDLGSTRNELHEAGNFGSSVKGSGKTNKGSGTEPNLNQAEPSAGDSAKGQRKRRGRPPRSGTSSNSNTAPGSTSNFTFGANLLFCSFESMKQMVLVQARVQKAKTNLEPSLLMGITEKMKKGVADKSNQRGQTRELTREAKEGKGKKSGERRDREEARKRWREHVIGKLQAGIGLFWREASTKRGISYEYEINTNTTLLFET
ncbi:hypothetical protein HDU76_011388 [Blyttiomyces sp. JEL0837]|nr:hypothetical protein HDU76_011388 [Blyttiomyces sp. JEL0837]